jgi:hypothetical protein
LGLILFSTIFFKAGSTLAAFVYAKLLCGFFEAPQLLVSGAWGMADFFKLIGAGRGATFAHQMLPRIFVKGATLAFD